MTDIPASLRHIRISGEGRESSLELVDAPMPAPDAGEVLIEVAAAGVNRPDLLQRGGKYPPPPGASDIMGLEVSGTVIAAGPDCRRFQVGDRVCALVASGGYATHCVAPEPQCLPTPDGVDVTAAGGLPETFFTVWSNLFDRAGLQAGERVLIHGGSSGIGTTAIQLAAAFGAEAITTVGSDAKADACLALGAARAINYRTEDFVAAVRQHTDGGGVHVVLDMVGGDYVQRNISVLADEGRLIQIAFLRGAKTELDMRELMTRRLVWTGSTLRPRPVAFKAAIAASLEEQVWPFFAAGTMKPVIHTTLPLAEADVAHRLMEESLHVGKILLVP